MVKNTLVQDFLTIRKSMRENEVTKEVARSLGKAAILEHLGNGDPYQSMNIDKFLDGVLPETRTGG